MICSSRYLNQRCAVCANVTPPQSTQQGLVDQLLNFLHNEVATISKEIINFCPQCSEMLQQFLNLSNELDRIEKALGNCAGQLQFKIYNSNQMSVEQQDDENNFRNILFSSLLDLLNGK
jgi:hypothetical protein